MPLPFFRPSPPHRHTRPLATEREKRDREAGRGPLDTRLVDALLDAIARLARWVRPVLVAEQDATGSTLTSSPLPSRCTSPAMQMP